MGDGGCAPFLAHRNVAPARTKRRLYSERHSIDTMLERCARLLVEDDLFRHKLLLLDNAKKIAFLQDQILFIVNFEFSAGVFGKQDLLPYLDTDGDEFAVVSAPSGSNGDDFTLHGPLFRCGIRQDDAALCLFFFGFGFHNNPIA
jgi:hypothetical protein